MTKGFVIGTVGAALLLIGAQPARSAAVTIDFDNLPDSTIVTNQYAGLTFSNAIILSAGLSLDEFEFPPHSGTNVVSDNGGPMVIAFSSPVSDVSGYFTYATQLTLTTFDSSDVLLATETSLFNNNEALSGDAGSSPNELISFNSDVGISMLEILGNPEGGSFTLDDLSYTSGGSGGGTSVAEPSSFALSGIATFALCLGYARRRRSHV